MQLLLCKSGAMYVTLQSTDLGLNIVAIKNKVDITELNIICRVCTDYNSYTEIIINQSIRLVKKNGNFYCKICMYHNPHT